MLALFNVAVSLMCRHIPYTMLACATPRLVLAQSRRGVVVVSAWVNAQKLPDQFHTPKVRPVILRVIVQRSWYLVIARPHAAHDVQISGGCGAGAGTFA